jgi:hypothetical protein
LGQTFYDAGLANTSFSNENDTVLPTLQEDLRDFSHFLTAPNDRLQLPFTGELG